MGGDDGRPRHVETGSDGMGSRRAAALDLPQRGADRDRKVGPLRDRGQTSRGHRDAIWSLQTWNQCLCTTNFNTGWDIPTASTHRVLRRFGTSRTVAALERKVGIVEGYWTPLAAHQGAMLVSHLTPRDAEEVLATLGHMQPSKSSLDRLPKALPARWEAQREDFETTVREATVEVPDAARAVVVSLDGVMAPMRGASHSTSPACRGGQIQHRNRTRLGFPRPQAPVAAPETGNRPHPGRQHQRRQAGSCRRHAQ